MLQQVIKQEIKQEEIEKELKQHREHVTPDSWIKRDPRLIPLTGALPFNAEPPMIELMKTLITPTNLHYVRNHGVVPNLKWKTHSISVKGFVTSPKEFSMNQLLMVGTPLEVVITIACDGNRRKELNLIKHTRGFNWGPGAVATSVWKGIKLTDVLQACGGLSNENAKFIHFTGADDLPMGRYSTSVPVELLPQDTILAYEMNGEKLSPDHGFPVRVILPGFVGGRMVKWLKEIEVLEEESQNHYHLYDNKVLPFPLVDLDTPFQSEFWKKPEFVLYQLNINSVISSPAHEEWLEIKEGEYEIKGYAYSGGGRVITRVEVSVDNGSTWKLMKLKFPQNSNFGGYKCYSWCHWKGKYSIFTLLRSKKIIVRAWDQSNNTQPRDHSWNVLGMMNNSWYEVYVYTEGEGSKWLTFKHPVLTGALVGGWMMSQHLSHVLKPAETIAEIKHYTMDEVKKHTKKDDLWIIINRCVVDVTNYANEHPGGSIPLLLKGGQDASLVFNEIHGKDAYEIKDRYTIGVLSDESKSKKADYALDSKKWITSPLIMKKGISHDTRLFRFQLSNEKKVGLPLGQHVLLSADITNCGVDEIVVRPYTPVTPVTEQEDQGYIDLIVKIYFPGNRPGGVMSMHLDSLNIGDTVRIKGSAGPIFYNGNGVLTINGRSIKVSCISMIAGGTGITPMYQILRYITSSEEDDTRVSLLFSNKTEEDILLFDELNSLCSEKFSVWYTITDVKEKPKGWKFGVGHISEHMIREHLFQPSRLLLLH